MKKHIVCHVGNFAIQEEYAYTQYRKYFAIRRCISHKIGRKITYIPEVMLGSGGDALRQKFHAHSLTTNK